jgi:hypothetical protein
MDPERLVIRREKWQQEWQQAPSAGSGAPRFRRSESGPPGIRTLNLRIKSPLLCQIELEARVSLANEPTGTGRVTEGTRTPSLQDHNLAL